ncbi:hypothetical protein TRSC58_00172 [Trypanosoma rangeli SC58]|uniref:Uncharacterized protein n=1 Tax=Trypanosoma rangeli SC58 TaxID=429131 RepID=A0A061JD78_TRYRA|nr:hypothetical protein TRSC58_00172 [Trypanosoma rangeli SC58]
MPVVSVANSTLLESFQSVRLEAQRMVFVYNPTYMLIASAKSLVVLLVLQYHFDYGGGWDRFVVCSAANLMSGLLTPVLEYATRWLLPRDHESGAPMVVVEPEEPADSVLIVEVLGHISRLELEDLGTVMIQGIAFIVFGAVLLPALLVFCLPGLASFLWVFVPLWALHMAVCRLYYGYTYSTMQSPPRGRISRRLTPATEFAKAALLKVLTLFMLQWSVQCSFLFGLILLKGGGYNEALRIEIRHQLWGCYNPLNMTSFQWFCFASQILF